MKSQVKLAVLLIALGIDIGFLGNLNSYLEAFGFPTFPPFYGQVSVAMGVMLMGVMLIAGQNFPEIPWTNKRKRLRPISAISHLKPQEPKPTTRLVSAECPHCGAPLKSNECEYCGYQLIHAP